MSKEKEKGKNPWLFEPIQPNNRTRLNPKQLKFIRFYMLGNSGAESARLAKYSLHTAREAAGRMLKNPKVIKEIEKREAKVRDKLDLDVVFWVKKMLEVIEDCTEKSDNPIKLKALDLTGKYLNLFTTNVKVDASIKTETLEQYLKRVEYEKQKLIESNELKLINLPRVQEERE